MVEHSNSKTVLITGAAGALGSQLSRQFVSAGFNTVMVDRNRRGLEAAWDAIVAEGLDEPVLHPLDLAGAGPGEINTLLEAITGQFGGLDGIVHCAVKFTGLRPLEHISPAEWLELVQVNLNAAWLLSTAALPLLRQSESGFLFFLLEDLPKMNGAYWGAYGVTKSAVATLAGQFAAENANSPLRVLGIDPGPMSGPLRAEAYHAEDPTSAPHPSIAARRICDLARGLEQAENVIVEFSD